MKIKSQRDFYSGLLFLVAGAAFAFGATGRRFGESAHPGPGYVPLLLSVVLGMIGAIVLFKALTIESEGGGAIGRVAWRPLIVGLLSVAGFGAALPYLGLVPAVPLLIVGISVAGDGFHWKRVLAHCVALTLGSWLVLVWGLKLALPLWPRFLPAFAGGA